ncbi:hypothetical protein [Flavobacterium sp.]|uniref:hypothetical protein n=1 Tax=Flavobacterium sp. TaxID=239 RepID=UPI003919C1B1
MTKTKQQMDEHIQDLIVFELERAREKFPKITNSPHEGFAVLKEEIDELDEEMDLLRVYNDVLWKCVRNDDLTRQKETLAEMRIVAVRMLKEAIQVGAMIDKYSQDVL